MNLLIKKTPSKDRVSLLGKKRPLRYERRCSGSMADDLALQCSSLRLADDEGGLIDLGGIDCEETNEKLSLLLVGRVCTERPYNIDAFKRTMLKVWAPTHNLVIMVIRPNLYAFQFFHWRVKEKVLEGGPWCWDNHLIVLKEVEGDEQPEDVELKFLPFRIRVLKLSFNCYSNAYVKALTKDIGDFLEIEDDVLGIDHYRCIRRLVDISKPLRRFQWIQDKKGREVKVEYKYERLPYFCFACGIIGHSECDCLALLEEDKKKKLGWGLHLQASPRKGHARNLEELSQITNARRQLFVTKENDASRPKPAAAPVVKGEKTTEEVVIVAEKASVGKKGVLEELLESGAGVEDDSGRVEEERPNSSLKQAPEMPLFVVGTSETKVHSSGKHWKRAARLIQRSDSVGGYVKAQKRNAEAVSMDMDEGIEGVGKKTRVSSHANSGPPGVAVVGHDQPRQSQ